MTDEKLEKKVRKIRWQEVVGAVAVTAGVFGGMWYVAHHFYGKGHEAGVYEGHKSGVEEGQKEGFASGSGFGFIDHEFGGVDVSLRRQDPNGSTLYMFKSNEFDGKPAVVEFVQLENSDGRALMLYGNMDSDTSVHDGIVDYIGIMSSGREFYRDMDYAGNEGLFIEADNILDSTRRRFSQPEWLNQ
ncbi:MAG: hypothetical protein AABX27_01590 [Nanoarchaeota archaeon]